MAIQAKVIVVIHQKNTASVQQRVPGWEESIRSLILDEQADTLGKWLPVEIESYIDKILTHADFAYHQVAGRCQGFAAYYCKDEATQDAFVSLFLVAPQARGSGLGTWLLNEVIQASRNHHCTRLTLWVHKENHRALHFYQRQGFQVQDERLYELLMVLPIPVLQTSAFYTTNVSAGC